MDRSSVSMQKKGKGRTGLEILMLLLVAVSFYLEL